MSSLSQRAGDPFLLPTSQGAARILLLELDAVTRAHIETALENSRHSCRTTSTTTDTGTFNLVIADAEAWRNRPPDAPHDPSLPILLVCSHQSVPDTLPPGAVGLLIRPLRSTEVVSRIETALHHRAVEREIESIRSLHGEQTRMWNVLVDFSRAVNRLLELDQIFDSIVDTAVELTSSRRVSLMLPDDSHENLVIVRACGIEQSVCDAVRVPIGSCVAGSAFQTGKILTSDLATGPSDHDEEYRGDSYVSMPISTNSIDGPLKQVGVLNITNRVGDRPFTEWELEFIEVLAKLSGSAIDDMAWRRTREKMLRVEHDLEVAREIQLGTLPTNLPVLSGYSFAAWSVSAEKTGGDSYDVIGLAHDPMQRCDLVEIEPRRAVFVLADATGHGIGPALSVTQARSMIRMALRAGLTLDELASMLNQQLHADLPSGRFITAWFAELDAKSHQLRILSAGAGPSWIYKRATNEIVEVGSQCIPLGICDELADLAPSTTLIEPGDRVLVASDGVTEARDHRGEYFGVDRLQSILTDHAHHHADHLAHTTRDALTHFTANTPPADDMTLLTICRHEH